MTDKLIDREAERGVLGALLLGADPAQIAKARQLLTPQSFGVGSHGTLYTALCAILDRQGAPDIIAVRNELGARLGDVGGVEVVAGMVDTVPTSANLVFHAQIVHDLFLRRELVRHGELAKRKAQDKTLPIHDGVAETVTGLVQSLAPSLAGGVQPLGLYSALESLTTRQDGALDPGATSTGLSGLDDLLGGLGPRRMVVVAAGPKKGKTSLALHMARRAAEEGPVFFVSLEMGNDELTERLVMTEAGVTNRKRAAFSDREVTALCQAAGRMQGLQMQIDEHSRTPHAIHLALQSEIALGRTPKLVVIDYLQLLRWPGKSENKNVEIGNITRFLKVDVAKGLNLPVLLLSQLSRARVESGKERPPILTDLRDSGSIEQDADQIVMLHYAGAEDGKTDLAPWGPATRTEVYVRGNRHGPGGKLDVHYNRRTGQWRDISRYDPEDA